MSQHALSAKELADRLEGSLRHCPGERSITSVMPLDEAAADSISFLSNPKYQEKARTSSAGLILVDAKTDLGAQPQLVVENPYWAFARCIGWLHFEPAPEWSESLIHPSAYIGSDCRIAPGVSVGARTLVGARSILHPGVHVGEDCVIGEECELYSGVVLYRRTKLGNRVRVHANSVLGSDGYGYVLVKGRHEKVPQVGWVELGDDVEIGAGTTVDRGVLGPTRIGKGTKVDNLVQLAHNVKIGEHCLIVAQVGISGSTSIGDYATLAGKVGVVGHVQVGKGCIVGGNSVVAKDVPDGAFVTGFPARPHREWMESQAALNRLPRILKEIRRKG